MVISIRGILLLHDSITQMNELVEARKKQLEEFISSLPEERQTPIRQFQWRLDAQLSKYKDPVARMNKMVEIFWEGVKDFQQALEMTKKRP